MCSFCLTYFKQGGRPTPLFLLIWGADHPSFNHLLALLDRQKKLSDATRRVVLYPLSAKRTAMPNGSVALRRGLTVAYCVSVSLTQHQYVFYPFLFRKSVLHNRLYDKLCGLWATMKANMKM